MSLPFALAPTGFDPRRERLAELERQVAARERDLAALKLELHELQDRYLQQVGVLYAELTTLDGEVMAEEIRQGIRPPFEDDDEDAASAPDEAVVSAACANRAAPSGDLKKIFRDVARAIHPDRALDEPARCRRHSLMAEANRAYAERDEDRLRLILRTWEESPDAVGDDDPASEELWVERRLARLGDRLVAIEAELADVKTSAIAGLHRKIAEAASQGWDLFAEMLRQVRREIARAKARLASLRRSAPGGAGAS
jgi:uncharacterized coiled-coil protein SlyX